MDTAAFNGPIRLRPGVSRRLALGLIAAYGSAMTIVLPLAWPWWAKPLLETLLITSGIRSFRWHVLHRGDAITEVIAKPEGEWVVTTYQRGTCRGTLAADSLVQPWLTVLIFKLEDGRRRSVVLLPDNIDAHEFRRLRVRLRYPF